MPCFSINSKVKLLLALCIWIYVIYDMYIVNNLTITYMGSLQKQDHKRSDAVSNNDNNKPSTKEIANSEKPVASVAYHVTLTACQLKFVRLFRDDLSVLKHSIELNSYPLNPNSKYSAQFYGIVPPHLKDSGCAASLQAENFTVRILDLPATPETIKPPLSQTIARNGCCGHSELMKLHIYTIDPKLHPVSVNLDLDTLVLKPFDTLFDTILYPHDTPNGKIARERLISEGYVAPTYIQQHKDNIIQHQTFDAFYTKDYNMVRQGWQEQRVGMQGGFMMVRPNQTIFDELIQIVKDGNFIMGRDIGKGWNGSGYGMHIWGAQTIQGLLAYYYNDHWSTSVELHRCRVNQIADNPRRSSADQRLPRVTLLVANSSLWHDTTCRDGRQNCDDTQCQNWPINETTMAHFTYCKTPRRCMVTDVSHFEYLNQYACTDMVREWFRTRQSLERHRKMSVPVEDESSYFFNTTFGYCNGPQRYVPMKFS